MATLTNTTTALHVPLDSTPPKYDPNTVIAAAHQKCASGDWEGGQFTFQSHLLEWTDDAREGTLSHHHQDIHQLREAITTLYLAYAQYLITAQQFKSAIEVYEDAIHTTVLASSNGRIYQEYARFLLERNKRKSAQDIYKQALVLKNSLTGQKGAVQDEQDRELLWHDFLEMMQESNPDLTMKSFRQAVLEEQTELPPSKRQKVEEPDETTNSTLSNGDVRVEGNPPSHMTVETSKTHVVTLESVEQTALTLRSAWQALLSSAALAPGLPPDVLAAWMSRDGQDVPQAPEPPLFAPSPPKLSDPTAKDKLGVDLAVRLVQRLLNPSGGIVLEVCRALWMLQGLLEQCKYEAFQLLDARFVAEHDRLEAELDARLSVAGTEMSEAVSLMNDRERQISNHHANQQRQQLVYQSAWDFRQLLCLQQQVLAQLDVPGFEDGPTVDAETLQLQSYLCQYLHSAFYIRNRMGSEPHETMLKNQLKKLLREQEQQNNAATHSPKIIGAPGPANRNSPVPPFHQQQYGASMNNSAPIAINNVATQAYGGSYAQLPYTQNNPQMMMPPGMPVTYPIQTQMMPGNGMYAPQQMMMMPPPLQQQPSYPYPMAPYNGLPPNVPYGGELHPSQYPPPPYYQQ